jgi:hypothetical protein
MSEYVEGGAAWISLASGNTGISRAGYKKIPRMRNGCETEA